MNTVKRIPVIGGLLAAALIHAVLPDALAAQRAQQPEIAVAARFKNLPQPIALDPRAEGGRLHGRMRTGGLTADLAAVLNARVAEFEEVYRCGTPDPVSGPRGVCRLIGAESYVAISDAVPAAGNVKVRVKVFRNDKDTKRSAVGAEWEVVLRQDGAEREVQTVRLIAIT